MSMGGSRGVFGTWFAELYRYPTTPSPQAPLPLLGKGGLFCFVGTFLFGMFSLCSLPAFGQLDNSAFEERWVTPTEVDLPDGLAVPSIVGKFSPYMINSKVGLFAHSFSYFRNLEYFNAAENGKTLFGQQFQVRAAYLVYDSLMVSGGVWGRKDFGTSGIGQIRPVFTVRYRKGRFGLLFGTLEGNVSHRFIEPLLDYESAITTRIEEGFSLQWWGYRTKAELYLDWAEMIYPFDKRQEQLNVGGRITYNLLDYWDQNNSLNIIGQFKAFHKGGQLDSSRSKPGLATVLTPAIGLKLNQELGGLPFDLQAEAHLLATNGIGDSTQIDSRLKAGRAFYGQVGLGNPHWQANVGYWQARGYYVPGGAPIYSSRSENVLNPGMVLPGDRKLWFLRGQYQWNLAQYRAFATLRAEYIYDVVRKAGDYNYQLYLNVRIGN